MSLGPYQNQSNNLGAHNLGNAYPNAFFDYLSKLMPRKLKTLFKWLEYLYVNCGQVFSVIKKFSEYPITSLTFDTTDSKLSGKLNEILCKHVKIKAALINVGLDYFVYGNTFVSVFKPFTRWLICTHCNHKHNGTNYPYEWMPSQFKFRIKCSACGKSSVAAVAHEKLKDTNKIKIIRWDPKEIDINWNPVTGESEYYYTIPERIKARLRTKKPDKFLLNTLPWEFIQTVHKKKIFKFRDDQIYHMKNPAPAGINQEWGFPGLIGCLKPFFYTAILRKANEAIAYERLVPWRILFPQASTSNSDPAQFVNLSRWSTELKDAIQKWRRDPNLVKLSPIPVGMQQVGGDGRALLVANEIAQTEEGIITSMGVPKEFIYGGLTHAGGSVTLRMLENLLFTYTDQLTDLLQWVVDQVAEFAGLQTVPVGLVDFKMIDDIQQKQLLGQLYQQKEISATTFLKAVDIDIEKERDQIIQDEVKKHIMNKTLERKIAEMTDNLAAKAEQNAGGNPLSYDPNLVMQVAYQEAQTMLQMDEQARKQRVAQLQMQDPVLSILVDTSMKDLQKQMKQQGAYLAGPPQMGPDQSGGQGNGQIKVTPENSQGSSPSTPPQLG